MSKIMVDTSALIAFFIQSEKHHPAARRYISQYSTARWIILNTVFDEFVTWMRAKVSISASIQVGTVLRAEHGYINISEADDAKIWEAFCRYDDKLWSYTDYSILVMSQKLVVPEVFAFDDHIRQMAGLGVVCVP
jgi:predicted nucleic acid-binding protein